MSFLAWLALAMWAVCVTGLIGAVQIGLELIVDEGR
jgi:hypothetical protein